MSRFASAAVAVAIVLVGAPAVRAQGQSGAVQYIPPADAAVVDLFRPPAVSYGRGNRGVDYGTTAGDPVWAAADGVVVFAGPVGRSLHVTVLHGDGIRTTYSFLAEVGVRRGQAVRAGDRVGTAGGPVHFGARAGGAYVDPLVLLQGGRGHVRLVADGGALPPEDGERSAIARLIGAIGDAGGAVSGSAVGWARSGADLARRGVEATSAELAGWLHYARTMGLPLELAIRLTATAIAWQRTPCTAASVTVPRRGGRRIAVLVGGVGSRSGSSGVLKVDTGALGYAPADRFEFSYRGGTADRNPYEPIDTHQDIEVSGAHLAALLTDIRRRNPGVPIDVIAHSQGGIVARSALADLAEGSRLAPVSSLTTLASPHGGADAATAIGMVGTTESGRALIDGLSPGLGAPGDSVSVSQLSEVSPFMQRLADRPLPPGVRVVSLAARGDLVVPSARSHLPGARNVVVTVDAKPTDQHSALPGSPAAQREMALAMAGLPPACQSLETALSDAATGQMISHLEDVVGAVATAIGHAADARSALP